MHNLTKQEIRKKLAYYGVYELRNIARELGLKQLADKNRYEVIEQIIELCVTTQLLDKLKQFCPPL